VVELFLPKLNQHKRQKDEEGREEKEKIDK